MKERDCPTCPFQEAEYDMQSPCTTCLGIELASHPGTCEECDEEEEEEEDW